ncbi:MAG: diguanylate cyclase, partial [Pseudomonadota bacterium]
YVLYVGSFCFTVFNMEWLAAAYLWTESHEPFIIWMLSLSLTTTIAMAALFIRALLNTRKHLPKWDYYISRFMLISIVVCYLLLFLPPHLGDMPENHLAFNATLTLSLIAIIIFFITGFLALRKGVPAAKYYLSAWSLFLLGIFLNGMRLFGWLPTNILTLQTVFIGALCEVTFLSFALADRINALRRERDKAQKELLRTQRTLNDELEQQVADRTHELEAANQQLTRLSNEDGLTQLFNRRYFDKALAQEWQRQQRQQTPLSLIMCDIDYFKQFNDTYGHQAGDDCLQQVAKTLKQHAKRPYDVAARYGGEEFAVILPQTHLDDACRIAESIRKGVEALDIPHQESQIKEVVSMSFGVVSLVPARHGDINELVKLADEALYQSKAYGRDRVSVQAQFEN